jgi:hypothetical protein
MHLLFTCPTTRHEDASGERKYSSYSFLTSALDRVSDQRHARLLFPSVTRWIGGWVGSSPGLDTEARGKTVSSLQGIESRPAGRPVRSQKY